ncbi:biotin--[acetyl-CoA-carboxylase] ligase [Hydrotalea sp.]|uniref:biotin--[acetyl-CoA-carboxylase] ligase n=1 Tax=Hydrotalea sp. TaxID=2881279 RepID=UPI003D12323E
MSSNSIIPTIGERLIELSSIDSTNNYALQYIKSNLAEHGTVIFAHEQTAGKGQRGKSWVTAPNSNLTLSAILNMRFLSLPQQFYFSAAMALAVQQFFNNYTANETVIKWPNDIYWNDRKAGGILIENSISEKGIWNWAVVGIGLNINQTQFPDWLPNPVALKQITGKTFNCKSLAIELCYYLQTYFALLQTENFQHILALYNHNLYKKNCQVTLKKNNELFETNIIGVNAEGQLITKRIETTQLFSFGEIELVIPKKK